VCPALENGKLIAAEPRDCIAATDDLLNPLRDLLEQPITDRVAERVVDVLEVIEIEIEHRKWRCAGSAFGESARQLAGECPPVHETGERIMLGKNRDLFVCKFQLTRLAQRWANEPSDDETEQEAASAHEPGAVVAGNERSIRDRYSYQVPARITGLERAANDECAGRHWFCRPFLYAWRAQPRPVHMQRHRIRRRAWERQVDIEAGWRGGGSQDVLD